MKFPASKALQRLPFLTLLFLMAAFSTQKSHSEEVVTLSKSNLINYSIELKTALTTQKQYPIEYPGTYVQLYVWFAKVSVELKGDIKKTFQVYLGMEGNDFTAKKETQGSYDILLLTLGKIKEKDVFHHVDEEGKRYCNTPKIALKTYNQAISLANPASNNGQKEDQKSEQKNPIIFSEYTTYFSAIKCPD